MEEIWRDIPGYEGFYQASSLGKIRSVDHVAFCNYDRNYKRTVKGKILSPTTNRYGYSMICMSVEGKIMNKSVHQLVALAFLPNPNNFDQINHKNEIKTDNRPENLEWCDAKYNANYGTKNKRTIKNRTGKTSCIAVCCTDKNGTPFCFSSIAEASRQTGVYYGCIRDCLYGKQKTAGGYIWKKGDSITL